MKKITSLKTQIGNINITFFGDIAKKNEYLLSEEGKNDPQPDHGWSEFKLLEFELVLNETWTYGQAFAFAESLPPYWLGWSFPLGEDEETEEFVVRVNGQDIDLNSKIRFFFLKRDGVNSLSMKLEHVGYDPGFEDSEMAAIHSMLQGHLYFWCQYKNEIQYDTLVGIEVSMLEMMKEQLERRARRLQEEVDYFQDKEYFVVIQEEGKEPYWMKGSQKTIERWNYKSAVAFFERLEQAERHIEGLKLDMKDPT